MLTVTDLFAGAGGSSTGMASIPGVTVRIAANHWQLACDIHNVNHPNTDHAAVDLHREDPRFFPKTDVLWASPECTKWSQANGSKLPAIDEGLFEDPNSSDAANRSRLLMFDVLRFVEHHRYRWVIVENVVDIATQSRYRTAWDEWRRQLRNLGYAHRVLSFNAMHAQAYGPGAPQSRDRLFIVCWQVGDTAPDLDRIMRPTAWCPRCETTCEAVQSWKNGRVVGRYRAQYVFVHAACGTTVEPAVLPAAVAIDWSVPGTVIGDRLAPKTRARIAAGIARYWGPLQIEAAGNTYDAAAATHPQHGDPNAYYRAWPTSEVMRTLHTTESKALVIPVEGRDGKEARPATLPMRTQTTRLETAMVQLPFVAELRGGSSDARPVTEPAATFCASGNHHALVTPYYGSSTTARPASDPIGTLTTVDRYALIHRHNTGGPEMTTPAFEELRTLTTSGHQSVIRHPGRPDVTAADLKAAEAMVSDCLFRMFMPLEVAAGMAFPADYVWEIDGKKPSNRNLVRAMGNAVCPPAARDILGALMEVAA